MDRQKARKMMKNLRKQGLREAFREPSYEEIQAIKARRPYLELSCGDLEHYSLEHENIMVDESPVGWSVMDVHGIRLIGSPGEKLYADFPYSEIVPSMESEAASTEETAQESEAASAESEESESEESPESESEEEALAEKPSEESEEEVTYSGTFWAEAIATTEYLIAMAYNYEWPSVKIEGSPSMARTAWMLCQIVDIKTEYQPTEDDKRCYEALIRNLEAYEAAYTASPGKQGGDRES